MSELIIRNRMPGKNTDYIIELQNKIKQLEQALDEIQQTYTMLRDEYYDAQAWRESSIIWDEIIAKQAREKSE